MTWPTDRPGYPLRECPPGLFIFGGTLCFRSEYSTTLENPRRHQPDAYVVESGEYFWGGAKTSEERSALSVFPVEPITPADLDAAVQAEREACAEACERKRVFAAAGGPHTCTTINGALWYGREQYAADCRDAIRARGPADALAEAQKAAYREGWNDRESDFLAGVDRTGMVVVSAGALAQARREGMEAAAKIVAASGLNGPGYAAIILAAMAGAPKEYDHRDNTPHDMAAGSAIRSAAAGEEG